MSLFRRTFVCGALAGALCLAFSTLALAADAEKITGTLADGTSWEMTKPANWNGTILLDLDGAGFPASAIPANLPPDLAAAAAKAQAERLVNPYKDWLLAQGFATGGTQREPVGYDFLKAVDNLLVVRQHFTEKWGAPKRTIAIGNSRGAFVARLAVERRPDIFAGALLSAGGGGGQIAGLRDRLNALFTLKALINPQAPLKLVNIDNVPAESAAVAALVKEANATPQGRARLALAAAYEQFALWTDRAKAKPAPADYDAQVDQIAQNFAFGNPPSVRAGVEKIAGGNVSWNTDVDYADLLRRSGRSAMVEALYKKAGLDLSADLAVLAKAPRISADPKAVAKEEPQGSYTGKIKGPVVNVDNDDPVDAASYKLSYAQTVKNAGAANLFRLLWADGAGHGGQSSLDRAVGFRLLIRRLDTGKWGDVSLPALKAMGEQIASEKPELGRLTLFDPGPITPALFAWDASNWRTYKGK
jgi:pimeloyl-ACP methyl ester carboxylesterase